VKEGWFQVHMFKGSQVRTCNRGSRFGVRGSALATKDQPSTINHQPSTINNIRTWDLGSGSPILNPKSQNSDPIFDSPIHPFTHSPIHTFTDSPIHPFTDSPIHRFTHSPIHPFIHLPTFWCNQQNQPVGTVEVPRAGASGGEGPSRYLSPGAAPLRRCPSAAAVSQRQHRNTQAGIHKDSASSLIPSPS